MQSLRARLPPIKSLVAFEASARLLSFTLAAEELHISQSAVSQQIRQFEERLDFKLFRRLTRRLELTDDGRRLYETIRRSLHALPQKPCDTRVPRRRLRVSPTVYPGVKTCCAS